jgi:antitoxin (DNA-binding transcriptional repressor) of toxin-antitoxin stability system
MSITATVENGAVKVPAHIPDGTQVEITVSETPIALIPPAESGEELPTIYERLKEFVGVIKDGPTDMAAEHDHYAHGAPKRNGR